MRDEQIEYTLTEVVRPEKEGNRLDAYWAGELSSRGVSRNQVRQWIAGGRAAVNGRTCTKPATAVKAGDKLELALPEQDAEVRPVAGPVDVLWQDKHLAVVNKPAGLSVHPAPSEPGPTLVNRLVHIFPQLRGQDPVRPGIVHRLDKDTSGLLLIALSEEIRSALSRSLAAREVEKEYLALVHGCPDPREAWIDLPLDRDPVHKTRMAVVPGTGRTAQTWYQVVHVWEQIPCALLRVRIVTGRTHQIRVHLAHMGHAVLGDGTYGPRQAAGLARRRPELARFLNRQMLHAWRLGFHHPQTGDWHRFCQPVPKDVLRVMLQANRRPQRVAVTGSAGCGKSALAGCLAGDRIPVWSADQEVAELYAPHADGWEMLRRSFGSRFVPDDSGPVDKQALFSAMQSSADDRRAILDLIHPLVEHRWRIFCKNHEQARMVLAEVPLLFETGWRERGLVDVAVNVLCPEQIRRHRLAANRGWSREIIDQMQAWQMPEEEKAGRADINVSNAGSRQELERTAKGLNAVLRTQRRKQVHELLNWLQSKGVL